MRTTVSACAATATFAGSTLFVGHVVGICSTAVVMFGMVCLGYCVLLGQSTGPGYAALTGLITSYIFCINSVRIFWYQIKEDKGVSMIDKVQ